MDDSYVRTEEVRALLCSLVQAMVSETRAVRVTCTLMIDGSVLFRIDVADWDRGKIVGKDGRIARSLRILLLAIEKQQKARYKLNIISDAGVQMQTVVRSVDRPLVDHNRANRPSKNSVKGPGV